jgi:hypothetical protein
MKKTIKIISVTCSIIFTLILAFFFSLDWLFPEWWSGSRNLGNNLYMMDWEKGNKIIVYCSNKSGRACYGGSSVIPHNHPREVFVEEAIANKEWVIVKAVTTESNQLCYYLIDKSFNIEGLTWETVSCDSIIQSHIIKTYDSLYFKNLLKQRQIDLRFFE